MTHAPSLEDETVSIPRSWNHFLRRVNQSRRARKRYLNILCRLHDSDFGFLVVAKHYLHLVTTERTVQIFHFHLEQRLVHNRSPYTTAIPLSQRRSRWSILVIFSSSAIPKADRTTFLGFRRTFFPGEYFQMPLRSWPLSSIDAVARNRSRLPVAIIIVNSTISITSRRENPNGLWKRRRICCSYRNNQIRARALPSSIDGSAIDGKFQSIISLLLKKNASIIWLWTMFCMRLVFVWMTIFSGCD